MSTPTVSYRGVLAANLIAIALIAGVGTRYLTIALQARGRVAALFAVPPWALYAAALLTGAAALGTAIVARLRRQPPERRVYRVLPLVAVVFLGVHLFVVPPCLLPLKPEVLIDAQLRDLEPELLADEEGKLTTHPARVAAALGPARPPFVGPDGEPLRRWTVVTQTGCLGPVRTLPSGLDAGTLLYCVAPDRAKAWISPVGTGGTIVGGPALVRVKGDVLTVALELSAPGSAKRGPEPAAPPVTSREGDASIH